MKKHGDMGTMMQKGRGKGVCIDPKGLLTSMVRGRDSFGEETDSDEDDLG